MIASCQPAPAEVEEPPTDVEEPAEPVEEPEEPADEPEEPVDETEEPVDEPEEVVEIVWMRFAEGADVELELMEEFNEMHPNINVVADTVPANDTYPKLVLTTEANEAPDVFMSFWTLGAASNDLALNLDPLIEQESEEWFNNYHEGGWVFHEWAGSYFGVPWRIAPAMVFVNQNMMEDAGLSLPEYDWTWSDYIAFTAAMTDPEEGKWGICQMGSAEDPGTDYQFYNFLFQAGGRMINDEGLAGFNTPEGVEALRFMVEFIDSYMVPPGTTAATANVCHDLLVSDRAGTWIDASIWLGIIEVIHGDIPHITFVPVPEGERAASLIGGTGLGIAATSEHPEEAWEFIKFMVSDESILRWSEALGFTPPNLSLLTEHPAYTENVEHQKVLWAIENQKLYPLSGYPMVEELQSILRGYLQAAYLGEITPEEALAGAEAEWNPILEDFQEDEWWDAWID
jgi:multiple sugar transport system substrate-binding protein